MTEKEKLSVKNRIKHGERSIIIEQSFYCWICFVFFNETLGIPVLQHAASEENDARFLCCWTKHIAFKYLLKMHQKGKANSFFREIFRIFFFNKQALCHWGHAFC